MDPLARLPIFPARTIPSIDAFEEEVARGRVARRTQGHLVLYVYNTAAMMAAYHEGWAPAVANARGIVFHRGTGALVSLTFEKFLNLGENEAMLPENLPDEPFLVTEKLDGTMVGVFHDGERWRAHTKGGLESEYTEWAEARFREQFARRDLAPLRGATLVFEGVYPRDRFESDTVVDYGAREELVLLAAYDVTRRAELRPEAVDRVAEHLDAPRPERYRLNSLARVTAAADALGFDAEGFVVQYERSGMRVKAKGAKYRLAHKALDQATKLAFWESMDERGRVADAAVEVLPARFRDDVLPYRTRLEDDYRRLRERIGALARLAERRPVGRERAVWVSEHCGPLVAGVFGALKGQDHAVHGCVWKLIRPAGNEWSDRAERALERTRNLVLRPAARTRTRA